MGGAGKREMRDGWALDSALDQKIHDELIGKRERRRLDSSLDLHTALL